MNNKASAIEKFMSMDDTTWQRHAHPWSVYTRYVALPLLAFGLWSRVWFGWWSLLIIAGALSWIWINPRIFQKPKSTNNWASKAVLGERVWLNHKELAIPEHHRQAAMVLSALNGLMTALTIYGLVALAPWPIVAGTLGVILAKSWFLDRMVWLFEDMRRVSPTYDSWCY